jgi:hypothetical protein
MPLPQDAVGWQSAEGRAVQSEVTLADWPQLLVLCHRCTTAGRAQAEHFQPDRLLLPHRALTFTLTDNSPFSYELESGSDRVVVRPASGAAQNTEAYFALNGLARAVGLPLEVPEDLEDDFDPRPRLRNRVWKKATYFAEYLRPAGTPAERGKRIRSVRLIAEDAGFWSVWATVLWNELQDEAVLAAVLQPGAQVSRPARPDLASETPLAGVHAFPGTRADWLPSRQGP